ncbi:N-acetyltransferase [Haloplanus rubicundus]|uniref:N-acetyltransferase n=1 Tax=Haloplanus rubicundus TaxID=1547898 RepID=A0A345E276_9EURY|nr:acyltransferase [Haloplanus rubicundus]AXG06298.1 N-acetyltransferase [Haloplanus rubicundus]
MKTKQIKNCDIDNGTRIGNFVSIEDSEIGSDCRIWRFVNIYGCKIGSECMIGSLVEIQRDVIIGRNTRIQSHAFVCSKVEIEENVFVSHGVKFVNDRYPPSGNSDAWESTMIRQGASLGTGAVIMPVEIGANAIVGAGAVVVDDVPPNAVVVGNPAEIIDYRD